MKHILLLFVLAANSIFSLQASCNSLVIAPKIGSIITRPQPVLIGLMQNNKNKPVKKKPVTVYTNINGKKQKLSTVVTNKYGVWSYIPRNNQFFDNGVYCVQAHIQPTALTSFWVQGTLFTVQLLERQPLYKSGNVSAANSLINFPFESSVVNTSTPTIVGSLLDANYNPVAGETVTLKVDNITVGSPTSDSNGVFSIGLSSALSENSHMVTAHCVESDIDLTSITFTIDITAPAAPVITSPSENETVTTELFTVTGTSEAYATITTYLDDDIYGQICYADEAGAWSIDYTATNNTHTLTAQASDLAQNEGSLSDTRNFIVNA